jgi:hypothetical protein
VLFLHLCKFPALRPKPKSRASRIAGPHSPVHDHILYNSPIIPAQEPSSRICLHYSLRVASPAATMVIKKFTNKLKSFGVGGESSRPMSTADDDDANSPGGDTPEANAARGVVCFTL